MLRAMGAKTGAMCSSWLGGVWSPRLYAVAAGYPAEIFFHLVFGFGEVDVAGDHENGVVGDVIFVEEGLEFFDFGGFEVFHVADGGPVVGMLFEDGGEEFVEHAAVGLVEAHAPFFGDDLAFGDEDLLGDFEGGHAVGFEPEGEFGVGGGEGLPVDGFVEGGEGVGVAADEADELHMFPAGLRGPNRGTSYVQTCGRSLGGPSARRASRRGRRRGRERWGRRAWGRR